jgi:hypothetical protein
MDDANRSSNLMKAAGVLNGRQRSNRVFREHAWDLCARSLALCLDGNITDATKVQVTGGT